MEMEDEKERIYDEHGQRMGKIHQGMEEGPRREESLLSTNCMPGPGEGRRWGLFS